MIIFSTIRFFQILVLQEKRFELPQESTEMEGNFCNDNVYGKFNVLWVTGAIRLEEGNSKAAARAARAGAGAGAGAGAAAENEVDSFDVWPKEENKLNPHTCRKEGNDWMYPEHFENDWMRDDPENDYVQALGTEYIYGLMEEKYGDEYYSEDESESDEGG